MPYYPPPPANANQGVPLGTSAGTAAAGNDPRLVGALQKSQNLQDVADPALARAGLQLGTAATANVEHFEAAGAAAAAANAAVAAVLPSSASAPAAVGARTGIFDVTRSLYLPTANVVLKKTRIGLAKARASAGRCKIACIGDSETVGYGGTRGMNDWPLAMRQALSEPRFPVGTGLVVLYDNNNNTGSPADVKFLAVPPQWGYGGSLPGAGNCAFHRQSSAEASNPIIFRSDAAGTVVEILYFDNSGGFQYQLDSGAWKSVSPTGTNTIKTLTVSGLSMASHQIAIQPLTTTTVYILAVNVRPANSLDVSNFGFFGARSADFLDLGTFYDLESVIKAYAPDLSIIQLGVNDAANGVAVATYKANMQTIINGQKAVGSEIALICSYQSNYVSVAAWDTFRSAMYDLADQFNAPLLDLTHRSGGYTQALNDGLMFDMTHPNGPAYTDAGFAASEMVLRGARLLTA